MRVSSPLLVACLVSVTVLLGQPSALAADPSRPDPGSVWFGPALDWEADSAEAYDLRFGADASLFGGSVGYPLTPTSELVLRDLSAQSARSGAVAVVTIEPTDLARLEPSDADGLAAVVAEVTSEHRSHLLLRFAPEMNGSWATWGRRPLTYVSAFRALADAVHAATDAAAMLWSPAYGGGYPFTAATNSTTGLGPGAPELDRRNVPYLDTDGDGEVTGRDDPYGPYYPGDDHVDWVGLTMLRYGDRPRLGANSVPRPNELENRFRERFGYDDDQRRRTFYVRFAGPQQHPLLLTTAAAYQPDQQGASEEAIKRAWLEQVVGAVPSRPMLAAVQWLEVSRAEPELGGIARWGLADDPALASRSRAVLEQGVVAFGPVEGIGGPDAAGGQPTNSAEVADPAFPAETAASDTDGFPPFLAGVLSTLGVVLVATVVALRVRRRRAVPAWLR